MGQGQSGPLHLHLPGLSLQLLGQVVYHAQAGGPDGMAAAKQPAAGIDGQFSTQGGYSVPDELASFSLLTEAQVLGGDDLGDRKAVVDLCYIQFLEGVPYPSLLVGYLGRQTVGGPSHQVVVRIVEGR